MKRKSARPRKAWHLWWLICLFIAPALTNCNCEPTQVGGVSELVAIPKTISYEAQQGETQTKKLVLEAKVGNILVNSIKLTEGAPHYKIDPETLPSFPKSLNQGDTITLSVSYTAPQGAATSGLIEIQSDASVPGDGKLQVRLLAQVNEQLLVFKPDPVSFGAVKRGTSQEKEVVGVNQGRGILKIQKIEWDESKASGFSFPDGLPKAPIELKPGESFKFKVKYEPTTAKLDSAEILFRCDGNCAPSASDPSKRTDPFPLKLLGEPAVPVIEVEPRQIDFGYVDVNSENKRDVKISNRGAAALKVSKISMKAKSSGAFLVPRLVDVEIAPGASKVLPVTFRPSSGAKHEGTIQIESNDPSQPLIEVRLFGQLTAPDIEVKPLVLDYGPVSTSKELAFNIANTGVRPLEIRTMGMFPGTSSEFAFKTAPQLPLTLNPNQFQSFIVVYTPTDKNTDNGKIVITSNDPDEPSVEVELKAKGSTEPACDLVGTPLRVNFGIGVLGGSKTQAVKWTNQGDKDCEISAWKVITDRTGFPPYAGPDVFLLPNAPTGCKTGNGEYTCSPALIVKPGNSLSLNVAFTPTTEKKSSPLSSPTYTGSLEATTNANPVARRVALEGVGKAPCLVAAPDTIDVGLVTVGCASQKEKITVYNICNTDVQLTKLGFAGGNANGFKITQGPLIPHTLKGNQSVEIEVSYKATAVKKETAVLEIETSVAHQNPFTIPMAGEGTSTAEQTDTFKQAQGGKTDILFVIDNSGSMGNDQKNLSDNFGSFIKWASTLQVDFHLAVTTTTVKFSPLSPGTAGEFVGTTNPFLTRNTPNYEQAFRQYAQVGTGGSSSEQGLEAMRLALSAPNTTTGKNKGFLRQDASLSIVTVSDEQDSSPSVVQTYINFLLNLKGKRNRDLVRFNIVIGIDENTLAPKCPSGAAASSGRYLAVAQAFRGVVASICNANWSNTLSRIGSVTFGLKNTFFLSRPADPNSISVKVDGVPVTAGANTWKHEQTDNSIVFKTAPKANSTIQVTYQAICF